MPTTRTFGSTELIVFFQNIPKPQIVNPAWRRLPIEFQKYSLRGADLACIEGHRDRHGHGSDRLGITYLCVMAAAILGWWLLAESRARRYYANREGLSPPLISSRRKTRESWRKRDSQRSRARSTPANAGTPICIHRRFTPAKRERARMKSRTHEPAERIACTIRTTSKSRPATVYRKTRNRG